MTTAATPRSSPVSPRPCRRCAPPTRAWPTPWSRPLRQHPPRLRHPVAHVHRLVRRTWVLRSLPAEPLTVARYLAARAGSGASIATMRLAAQRHRQGPRVGQAGIALPGPGRARLFERDGAGVWRNPSASPAPSPPMCWPSSASPPSSPASAAAASKRPSSRGAG